MPRLTAFSASQSNTPRVVRMEEFDYRALPLPGGRLLGSNGNRRCFGFSWTPRIPWEIMVTPVGSAHVTNPPHITPPALAGTTRFGKFQWYGFKEFTWVNNARVPTYYLSKAGSGTSTRQDWGNYSGGYGSAPMGTLEAQGLGGGFTCDPYTGVVIGGYSCDWVYDGDLCMGSSFRSSYGGYFGLSTIPKVSATFSDLLPFFTHIIDTPTARYYSCAGYPSVGFMVTYCGNPTWGTPGDSAKETLSSEMSLVDAATNGGAVLVPFSGVSEVTSFDPATGIMQGMVSDVNVSHPVPSVTGHFLATLSFLKTPVGGGASTAFTEYAVYDPGIGATLGTTYRVPMINGYTVKCLAVVVQDIGMFMDDGEAIADLSYFGSNVNDYPVTPDWPFAPAFQTDGPGEFWDDGEDLEDGPVSVSYGGNNWLGNGIFDLFDIAGEFWDDGENNPDGPLDFTMLGQGWLGWGSFSVADHRFSADDGESYADGALPVTNGYPEEWVEDGAFQVNEYPSFDDDGESYADGPLTLADGGDNWLGDGTFQVDI